MSTKAGEDQVVRTDRDWAQELIAPELRQGRLRQGWGYRPNFDLRRLSQRASEGALEPEERAVWKRNHRLLPEEPDAIQQGDLLLLPHVPEEGIWSLASAGANYRYEIAHSGDHGHIRSVRLLREEIPPCGPQVAAALRRTMRCQLPLWNIDHLAAYVAALVDGTNSQPPTLSERLGDCLAAATEATLERLTFHFGASEFEQPIQLLLQELYAVVHWSAGPGENGADFLCQSARGETGLIAVQVKMWTGTTDYTGPIEQLRQAAVHWPKVTECLLLTTAENASVEFASAIHQLQADIGVKVTLILRSQLLELLLSRLPAMVARASGSSV